MADQINNNIGRRKFFSRVGMGALAFTLLSSFPFKLFAKEKSIKKVNVKIHPSAVKRTK